MGPRPECLAWPHRASGAQPKLSTTFPDSTSRRQRFGLIAATAVLWWVAGAFGLFPLGWIALVPFFLALDGLPRKQRARWGYLAGVVCFFFINWWIWPTITRGGSIIGVSTVMAFVLGFISVALISAIHGVQLLLTSLFWSEKTTHRLLLVPLVWTGFDWLRCKGPIAHSWGALGFSQVPDQLLLQTVRSQHGLTLLCVVTAICVALWWRQRKTYLLLAPAAALAVLHLPLRSVSSQATGPGRALVIQTYVSSLGKNTGTGESPFQQAYRLTMEGLAAAERRGERVELIVWPETTAELVRNRNKSYAGLDWAIWETQGPKVPLLLGAGVTDWEGKRTNEAVLVLPERGGAENYAKRRVVPFGERAPLVEYLPFLQIFAPRPAVEPGRGEFGALKLAQPPIGIAPLICFESCFPQDLSGAFAKSATPVGSRFLVVITNDEWFGGTEAARQHRNMGRLRAVENGVPMLQSANGGESIASDANGRILEGLSFGEPGSFTVPLPGNGTSTVSN